jgi:N6-adenosine-specific RNA methylase IME4/DNA-binding XRE family transcriptional regulator
MPQINIRPWPEIQDLMPPLGKPELESLRESINSEGVKQAILILPDGRIIDGHHRWELSEHSAPYQILEISENRAFDLAIELNLARRQLSRPQLAAIKEKVKERQERLKQKALEMRQEGMTQQEVEGELGIDRTTVSRWENMPVVQDGGMHNRHSGEFDVRVSIPKSAHKTIYDRIQAGETQAQIASDFQVNQSTISNIKRRYQEDLDQSSNKITDPPSGKFKTLVVDPPWPIKKIQREERPNQDIVDYPTMSVEEIRNLPIADLADEHGCHVYLWVTHKYLPDGMALFEKWGVRYQCVMTWVKPTGMTPFSWMYNTEHVLFGRIGNLRLLRNGLKLSFQAPITVHSEKPHIFYERVVAASPEPRLELFARKERAGFIVWGDEINP